MDSSKLEVFSQLETICDEMLEIVRDINLPVCDEVIFSGILSVLGGCSVTILCQDGQSLVLGFHGRLEIQVLP